MRAVRLGVIALVAVGLGACGTKAVTHSTTTTTALPTTTMTTRAALSTTTITTQPPVVVTTVPPPTTTTTMTPPSTYCGTPGSIWQSICTFVDPPGTEYTVPASAQAACTALGGVNDLGSTVYGNDPYCYNVSYIGTDGTQYLDSFPYTVSSVSTTDIYGNSPGNVVGAATRQECASGNYPMANPGVNTPGVWNTSMELCQTRS